MYCAHAWRYNEGSAESLDCHLCAIVHSIWWSYRACVVSIWTCLNRHRSMCAASLFTNAKIPRTPFLLISSTLTDQKYRTIGQLFLVLWSACYVWSYIVKVTAFFSVVDLISKLDMWMAAQCILPFLRKSTRVVMLKIWVAVSDYFCDVGSLLLSCSYYLR